MKKLIFVFACFCGLLLNSSYGQNKEIIGEKGQEKSTQVIAPIDSKAKLLKLKTDINLLFTEYKREMSEVEKKLDELGKKLNTAMKELEGSNKMENFEMQKLMDSYTAARTLSSQVEKNVTETKNSVIQKIQ